MTPTSAQPFLGPRPFQAGETLYGRDFESRALLSMLIAERIVLLHAPSGAGKTSLVQAALIPLLEARGFTVLPPVRVGQEPPAGWAGNRYSHAALLALEEGRPPDEQLPLAELESLSLVDYLSRRAPADADADTVLVIDQFEEVLTRDPTDTAAKRAFFRELGEALRAPRRWALCVIREEYVAALESYARAIPTRLAAHFRLDLLSVDGALAALREPPRRLGVDFPEALAARLVDDLRRVHVQQADGTIVPQLGPSVEPVQLQVVGLRLWAQLPPGTTAITAADLDALGDVGSALGDYYAERVAAIARETGVSERLLRGWCERELITPQGVRGQVLQEVDTSAGLPNNAITRLIDAYLVRAELRRGATWYELAHDRLIAPVRAGNAAWFAANLSTLQRQAELWAQQGRPEGLLLRGKPLAEAERWAAANAASLTEDERDFLAQCRRARRRSALLRWLSVGIAVAAVIALILAFVAQIKATEATQQRGTAEANAQVAQANARTSEANRQDADQQRGAAVANGQIAETRARQSRARELAAAAVSNLLVDPQRSLLLARAAVDTTRAVDGSVVPEAVEALQQAAQESRVRQIIQVGQPGERPVLSGLQAVAFSPDGALLASAGNDGNIRLWDAVSGRALHVFAGDSGGAVALAFSPDGARLAGAAGPYAIVWDTLSDAELLKLEAHDGEQVLDVRFSPDGARLATAGADGTARVWDAATGDQLLTLTGHTGAVNAVTFSPDGTRLATASDDETAIVWDAATGKALRTLTGHTGGVQAVAFSPDGTLLATASADLTARIWDAKTGTVIQRLQGHMGSLDGLAFSHDGALLATTSEDTTARVWGVASGALVLTLAGHLAQVSGVAFSPDGARLATSSQDGTIHVWSMALAPPDSVAGIAFDPVGGALITAGDTSLRVWGDDGLSRLVVPMPFVPLSVAVSPDGRRLLAGGSDGQAGIWDAATGARQLLIAAHTGATYRAIFSPDGATFVTGGEDGRVALWDAATGKAVRELVAEGEPIYALAFSPDGRRLATGGQGGVVTVWDPATGASLRELTPAVAKDYVNGLAFSPDGTLLAAASDGGVTVVWDAATGAERLRLSSPVAFMDVAFSPDGALLATAGEDRTARVWDLATGKEQVALPHPARIYALAFSPDGRGLATIAGDGLPRRFPLARDELLALAETRAIRGPTATECKEYRLEGCAP